ncbi:MAG TPA: hypothetical protein VEQ59_22735 [Polyangiaceae bacterium]|nr:hypothetical protein [Polyangiaceae bacterium]
MKINLVLTLACSVTLWLVACSDGPSDFDNDAEVAGSVTGGSATGGSTAAGAATGGSAPASPTPVKSAQGPKLYVGLFGDNAVAVVDTATNEVLGTIAVPTGPHGLVITPDGAKVYVSSDGASTVSVIDTATDKIATSIEVGMTPHGLTISEDGTRLLLSDFGGNFAEIIDTATDKLLRSAEVDRPHNSAISPDGKLGFEASQAADTPAIVIVDLDAGQVLGSVPLEHAPRALDYAPDDHVYFTMSGVDALEVLDPATKMLGTPIDTGGSPHHMLATKDGEYELVVAQTIGALQFVELKSQSVVASVPTGTAPHWLTLSTDGKLAYVSDEGSNDVAIVDIAARKVVQTIAVGKAPRKLAVQPSRP